MIVLFIAIVFLSAETGYSADRPLKLRPALQFSGAGREVIKEGRKGSGVTKNKGHLIFHTRIVVHETRGIITGIIGFFGCFS